MGRKCCGRTCHRIPAEGRSTCEYCLVRGRKLRNQRKVNGTCTACSKPARPNRFTCEVCALRSAENQKGYVRPNYHTRYRDLVFDFYGRLCACCGESELLFLSIDHIDGVKLAEDRAPNFYRRLVALIRKGEPRTDLRTLCFNCNSGRARNNGVCPHEASDAR